MSETNPVIDKLETARNNILKVFIKDGNEMTVDDHAAHVNAQCAYGEIISALLLSYVARGQSLL